MKQPRVLVVAVIATVVVVAGCRSHGAKPDRERVRIAIGGQNQLIYLPTTLARELGYYADEGLEIDLQDHQGGAKALQALVGGSADVVSGFYDHTIQMAAEQREMVAFVTMLRFPGLVLTTSPQSAASVNRIEDLRGRVAGVTAVGSSSQMLLTYLLHKHGMSADAVSVTGIGSAATAIAAVERGKVDAAMMADPAFTMVTRRAAGLRVLADLRSENGVREAFGVDSYPASVLYASGDWIRNHRGTTAKLARAITRTLWWIHSHPANEIAAKCPPEFRGEDTGLYVEALQNSMSMFSPDGMMHADGAEAVHQLLAQSLDRVRTAHIDLTKTFTNEFVQRQ